MITDTADDIVTDEMVGDAFCAWHGSRGTDAERIDAALRAVAPMIAARAFEQCRHIPGLEGKFAWKVGAREEREACAQIVAEHFHDQGGEEFERFGRRIAAAIRARGETPPVRRPGEIDWSAMDKED
jgi:hypothetical protein